MFQSFWAVFWKEVIHIRRDPATRFIFAVPLVPLLLFGYAIEMEVQNIPTVVLDLDRQRESRELVKDFESTRYFRVIGQVHSDRELETAIVSGRARVGIKIPPDYSSQLVNGRQARVQVLIDGSDSTSAMRLLQVSQALGFLKSLRKEGLSIEAMSVDIRTRLLFNPNLESAYFFVPGLIGVILQLVTVMLTAFSIVRERERGTIEQLLVTPLSKASLILGKLVPYCVVGFAQTGLVLLVMVILFGVPIRGSLALLLFLSGAFLVPSLCLGILVSTFARNQSEAMQIAMIIMLPSIYLSGFIFPRESMPYAIYLLTFLIPATYYIEILRGIIVRGAGLAALWDKALALLIFGALLIVLSVLRFKKRLG